MDANPDMINQEGSRGMQGRDESWMIKANKMIKTYFKMLFTFVTLSDFSIV